MLYATVFNPTTPVHRTCRSLQLLNFATTARKNRRIW